MHYDAIRPSVVSDQFTAYTEMSLGEKVFVRFAAVEINWHQKAKSIGPKMKLIFNINDASLKRSPQCIFGGLQVLISLNLRSLVLVCPLQLFGFFVI